MTENETKITKWNLDGVIKYLYKKNELGGDESEKQYQVDNATLDLLEELQQYRAIGTVEECREAMERHRAKKPELYGDFEDGKLLCPNCEEDLMDLTECDFNCCPYCGQAIDWSDID